MSTIISSDKVYQGRILDVALEKHAMPDGRQSNFEIIRHPGGAAVLPVLMKFLPDVSNRMNHHRNVPVVS